LTKQKSTLTFDSSDDFGGSYNSATAGNDDSEDEDDGDDGHSSSSSSNSPATSTSTCSNEHQLANGNSATLQMQELRDEYDLYCSYFAGLVIAPISFEEYLKLRPEVVAEEEAELKKKEQKQLSSAKTVA